MAGCLNGANGQFTNLDGTEPMNAAPKSSAAGPSRARRVGMVCTVLYFVLLTAVAVIAFIMGGYSTSKVRSFKETDAVLVSDPANAPAGYTVYSLGTGLGYWSPSTSMLYARSDHGVVSYGKYAFLIGGMSANTTANSTIILSSVVRYDTDTGIMDEMESMPGPRYRFAYALLGEMIYVMGGTDSPADSAPPTNTAYVYNITLGRWKPLSIPMAKARVDPCGAAANGKVYVFGGYDEQGFSLATTEVYDPATKTPTDDASFRLLPETSNLVSSRGDCRAVTIDDTIYAVGGTQWFNNTQHSCSDKYWVYCYRFLSSVEAFVSEKWTSRASMRNARGDFGIETLPGGRIIVAGGETGNETQHSMAMYEVEEYVVQDNLWIQKAPLPEARFRDDLAYTSGRLYAFGGVPTCGLSANTSLPCNVVALKSVFAYFDIQYPRLYAYYQPAS